MEHCASFQSGQRTLVDIGVRHLDAIAGDFAGGERAYLPEPQVG